MWIPMERLGVNVVKIGSFGDTFVFLEQQI